jgi:predicted ATPase/DNA-binding SARP family transcriptional activator
MSVELTLLSGVSYRGSEIPGARLRGLLALLADEPRAGCSTARLVAGLWPDEQPENPVKAVQVLVSRARARLGADTIASTPAGYRLALDEHLIDAAEVPRCAAASARHARAGDHLAALEQAEAGLALCEGAAGWDSAPTDDPVAALRAARVPAYRSLVRARALALSRLGRPTEAVDSLTELTGQQPRDEEVLAELLRCEAATVGPAAALARYDGYRHALREDLGSDPGPALRAVHQELLRAELPAVRHGVPHEPNPLLGRDDDIAAVTGLLRTSRVTSIVGPGGLGKTRLAYAVSRRAEQRMVHAVALAGIGSDDDVTAEVAAALGVGEGASPAVGRLAPGTDALAGIVRALGPGPALLVLDNCEHLLRGVAELVGALVALSADVRVLTTSRAPLGLSSEAVYPLPELPLPIMVALFGQRARAARPDVELPEERVRALCDRLDGLPLAVELAAARVRVSSVAEIGDRLADRFALLRGGPRDAPSRHRTLHAVIDWSWNLLEPAGQAAMRALSVFPGGFTAEAARWVLGERTDADGTADVLSVLEQLVGQSLLKVTDSPAGTRFHMVETVREFSGAHRERVGETDRVVERFLAWARAFGVAHHESTFGADLPVAVRRIRAEQDNLGLALRYSLERQDAATIAATTAVLAALWMVESNFTRLTKLIADTAWALSHIRPGRELTDPALIEALRTAAVLSAGGAFLLRGPHAARCMVTVRRLPPVAPDTLVHAIQIVLRAAAERTGPDPAALVAMCADPAPLLAGMANGLVSYLRESETDMAGALAAARRMVDAFDTPDSPWLGAVAHSRIVELSLQLGAGEQALRHLERTLPMLTELGTSSATVIRGRWAQTMANLQAGRLDAAEQLLEQLVRSGSDDLTAASLLDLCVRAELSLARGRVEEGLRLWRQAADGLRHPPRPVAGEPTQSPSWPREVQAVAVIAHARHGRLDLVAELADELPEVLADALPEPDRPTVPPKAALDVPVLGALLLALAVADLDRGAGAGDPRARGRVARMIALAERFRFTRAYRPTLSDAYLRDLAERADGAAYADAVSTYAGLGVHELPAAAVAALHERAELSARDRV